MKSMGPLEHIRELLVGTRVRHSAFGYGFIFDVSKAFVKVDFDALERTFLRTVFSQQVQIDEPEPTSRF